MYEIIVANLTGKLSVEHELHDPTDYGILSTLADGDLEPVDSGTSKPIHAIVNYGPLPSVCSPNAILLNIILTWTLAYPRPSWTVSRAFP